MPGAKRSRIQQNESTSSSSSSGTIVGKNQEVPICGSSGYRIEEVFLVGHQNENPLMNHLILSTLFEYFQPVDLLSCRLVCKTWNSMAVPFVRTKCEVTIQRFDYSKPGNQRMWIKRTENRNIGAFVKLMRSNKTGIPFSKFNWVGYKGSAHVKKMFLRICGYTIKEMNLSRCDILLSHLSEILRNVPNLECFKTPYFVEINPGPGQAPVELFSDDMNRRPRLTRLKTLGIVDGLNVGIEDFQILIKDLLETAENVSDIIFMAHYIRYEQDDFDFVLEVLNAIQSTGRESSIRSLSGLKLTEVNAEILKSMILKNKGLKLKKLMIKYDGTDNWDDVWVQLASLCKDDLVELSIKHNYYRPAFHNLPVRELLPLMKKLISLEARLTRDSSLLQCNLKLTFPVLEKLTIWSRFATVDVDDLLTGEEPCESLKSLRLEDIPLKLDTLTRIIFMFPALTKIQVKLKVGCGLKTLLRTLWTEMTQLEELHLHILEAFQIDPLFTGITLQECQNIKLSDAYLRGLKSMSEEEWTREILELGDARTNPSIANLTNLRRLRISFPSSGDRMSDVTACFGLMHLKFLKHISVDMCQMSENCCKVLVTQMKLESWEFLDRSRWADVDKNIIPPRSYPYED